MNFLIRILLFSTLFFITAGALAQAPDGKKGGSRAKNEKLKEEQKKAYHKQEKAFQKKHFNRQTKEVKKRMRKNLQQTNSYYDTKRKPLLKRIFPKKYKH